MVVEGAAVKSHLYFLSALYIRQQKSKLFPLIDNTVCINWQVSLYSWNAGNTEMEIPEMPKRYFALIKEDQGTCHAVKCWVLEDPIFGLLDFLQLEKMTLGSDSNRSLWNLFCPCSKLCCAGRKPDLSQAVKALYSGWQSAWPSECSWLPCKQHPGLSSCCHQRPLGELQTPEIPAGWGCWGFLGE